MKMPHLLNQNTLEREPLTEKCCCAGQLDEYIENDADRANSNYGTVIFDCVDPSPFYENTPGDLYIDEKELIELP